MANPIAAIDTLGLKTCFDNEKYSACANTANKSHDDAQLYIETYFDTAEAAISSGQKNCIAGCKSNSDINYALQRLCQFGCYETSGIAMSGLWSFYTGFNIGLKAQFAAALLACNIMAEYEVDDCSNC